MHRIRKNLKILLQILFVLTFLFSTAAQGQDFSYSYRGELSTWAGGYSLLEDGNYYTGTRVLPSFSGQADLDGFSFKLDLSLNGYLSHRGDWDQDIKLYRSSITYQSAQAEAIVGLQKITFGPARYLRPLMWFDRINPTDPMNITEGVTGAMFRYYTLNNANFWLWGLYGNDEAKGLERVGTDESIPEIGGRMQLPLNRGNIALSLHRRKRADTKIERRVALDFYYDIGIGLWSEARLDMVGDDLNRNFLSIGGDYTFTIGNGLNFVMEFMPIKRSDNAIPNILDNPQETLYAASLSYPLNIFDNVMGLVYYSKFQDEFYQYLQYQRSYDRIKINLALFNYPDTKSSLPTGGDFNRKGLGGQIMVIYNY